MSTLKDTPYLQLAKSGAEKMVVDLRTAHTIATQSGDRFAQIAIMDAIVEAVNVRRRVAQLLGAVEQKP